MYVEGARHKRSYNFIYHILSNPGRPDCEEEEKLLTGMRLLTRLIKMFAIKMVVMPGREKNLKRKRKEKEIKSLGSTCSHEKKRQELIKCTRK